MQHLGVYDIKTDEKKNPKKRWNILNSIKFAAHLVFRKKYTNTVSFITIKTLILTWFYL